MSLSKQVTNQNDVKSLGTILTVWAHPDDETFCAGGLLAAAVANGQTVICVTATRGEKGVQDEAKWPADKLGDIRTKELGEALKILGITKHHWLTYQDGACELVNVADAAEQVAEFIEQYRPDTILTFGPEGLTGHEDHAAVSAWVSEAVEKAKTKPAIYHAVITPDQHQRYFKTMDGNLNFFFNIDQPPLVEDGDCDICFRCTDELCQTKHQAFAAMPSQYTTMQQTFDQRYLADAFRIEAFVRAK